MAELRRYVRKPVDIEVEFSGKGASERHPGRATDMSLGGMFVEASQPLAFSADVVVYFRAPGQRTPVSVTGVVRWTRSDGMGIQFGLLGARETHAITELTKA